jgi:RNA polymerase subunit RPABC4/transcription elongation factor Spt4
MTKFIFCPECGGSNLAATGWFTAGGSKIRACMDCEKVFEVSDDTDLYPEVVERLFTGGSAE